MENDLRVHVLRTGPTRLLTILRHGVDAEAAAVVAVVAAKGVDEKRRKEQRMQ